MSSLYNFIKDTWQQLFVGWKLRSWGLLGSTSYGWRGTFYAALPRLGFRLSIAAARHDVVPNNNSGLWLPSAIDTHCAKIC